MMDKTAVETKLGWLEVEQSGFTPEGYPGFLITLRRGGAELATVLMEVDETSLLPECKIHVWNSRDEDPILNLKGKLKNNEMMLDPYDA